MEMNPFDSLGSLRASRFWILPLIAISACGEGDSTFSPSSQSLSFFVTSTTSVTGNLGGLAGADATCQRLASAVGQGSGRVWRAYLSVERDPSNGNRPTNARDRIGLGPWFNATGILVANNLTELHSRTGDPAVFVDEHGRRINGMWAGSPGPNEHDILTGSTAEGTVLAGQTCADWTSVSNDANRRVGHSDGFGGGGSTTVTPTNNVISWNSAHTSVGCANTAPGGGAGRFYCFARP
jgi:hypothetical protein